jgi:hypothetical protein
MSRNKIAGLHAPSDRGISSAIIMPHPGFMLEFIAFSPELVYQVIHARQFIQCWPNVFFNKFNIPSSCITTGS